jgi:hypothetical protein
MVFIDPIYEDDSVITPGRDMDSTSPNLKLPAIGIIPSLTIHNTMYIRLSNELPVPSLSPVLTRRPDHQRYPSTPRKDDHIVLPGRGRHQTQVAVCAVREPAAVAALEQRDKLAGQRPSLVQIAQEGDGSHPALGVPLMQVADGPERRAPLQACGG